MNKQQLLLCALFFTANSATTYAMSEQLTSTPQTKISLATAKKNIAIHWLKLSNTKEYRGYRETRILHDQYCNLHTAILLNIAIKHTSTIKESQDFLKSYTMLNNYNATKLNNNFRITRLRSQSAPVILHKNARHSIKRGKERL